MKLFWSTGEGDAGRQVTLQALGQSAVAQEAVPVAGEDVTFPPPGGGVAVVDVGGGGLSEVRGTVDGQTLVWDDGAQTWVAGAPGASPLTTPSEHDDFRNSQGGSATGSTGLILTPALQTIPVWFDLPWTAFANDSATCRIEQNSGANDHPGAIILHAEGGSNDYVFIYRGFGITGSNGISGGIVVNPNQVADHSWVTRSASTSNANFRFGLFTQIDVANNTTVFNNGSWRGMGWFLDSALTGNTNLWAVGANFGERAVFDTGISVSSFNTTWRRYSIRADANVADRYHWLIDDVEVMQADIVFTPQSENLKPMYYVRTSNGGQVRTLIDYYQTNWKTISR